MRYNFHTDPGHGWLEVTLAEVVALGISEQISHYSYQRGDKVYLEEDCDAALFINAKKQRGEEYSFNEAHTDNEHWIRRLPSYSPAVRV